MLKKPDQYREPMWIVKVRKCRSSFHCFNFPPLLPHRYITLSLSLVPPLPFLSHRSPCFRALYLSSLHTLSGHSVRESCASPPFLSYRLPRHWVLYIPSLPLSQITLLSCASPPLPSHPTRHLYWILYVPHLRKPLILRIRRCVKYMNLDLKNDCVHEHLCESN